MQLLRILYYPDPKLREVSKPVEPEDIPKARPFIDELIRAMYAFDGVAIAAPQVGVPMRIIVIDLRPETAEGRAMPQIPLVMVNPKILALYSAHRVEAEGCLSFPGVEAQVARYYRAEVEFLGLDGAPARQTFSARQAQAVQHEVEHLDGKLLIDHITSRIRRDMVERKMAKVAKRGGPRPRAPGGP